MKLTPRTQRYSFILQKDDIRILMTNFNTRKTKKDNGLSKIDLKIMIYRSIIMVNFDLTRFSSDNSYLLNDCCDMSQNYHINICVFPTGWFSLKVCLPWNCEQNSSQFFIIVGKLFCWINKLLFDLQITVLESWPVTLNYCCTKGVILSLPSGKKLHNSCKIE